MRRTNNKQTHQGYSDLQEASNPSANPSLKGYGKNTFTRYLLQCFCEVPQ